MTPTEREFVNIIAEACAKLTGENVSESSKPEHHDGEPFKGKRSMATADKYGDAPLIYTKEFRRPVDPDIYEDMCGIACSSGYNGLAEAEGQSDPYARWILRVDKPKPEWKMGDYACIKESSDNIIKITGFNSRGIYLVKSLLGSEWHTTPACFRPLTPADWTREINGVKVRAYENIHGFVRILFHEVKDYYDGTNQGECLKGKDGDAILRDFCRLADLPIMPWDACQKLQGGKFIAPE